MKTLGRWLRWGLLGALGLFLVWQLWLLGWVLFWGWFNPGETRFMEIRLAELRQKAPQAQLKQQWVPYERISIHLKRAIIAAEDAKFVDHEGFDWEGIQKAMEKNQKRGRTVAGGSTISQQLAKNLFLWQGRSAGSRWVRKGLETWYTGLIELMWPKRRILEVYANVVEFGDGVYGAQAAARTYFRRDAKDLTLAQSARMAAVLPSPKRYSIANPGPYVQRQSRWVERNVRQLGGAAYLDTLD